MNPLHADPEIAAKAGFDRPILHGLCTYGLTCRAILAGITDFDPEPILSHQVRFSAPVFPGDIITVYIHQAKTKNPVGRIEHIVLADGSQLRDSSGGGDAGDAGRGGRGGGRGRGAGY